MFPDVHQHKPVRKLDRNLVESTRDMNTWHVSQDTMEICFVCTCMFLK